MHMFFPSSFTETAPYPGSLQSHDQPSLEAILNQSLLNSPHQVYPSLCTPPLTQPVCPQILKQYHSVRLAQGVGGLYWVSPSLVTMLHSWGGCRWQNRREEFSLRLHPTRFPDLWPPINIPSICQAPSCNAWVRFPNWKAYWPNNESGVTANSSASFLLELLSQNRKWNCLTLYFTYTNLKKD